MARGNSADIIIIGAGMSGLVAASELHRRGFDIIVLEASSSVGGRVTSTITELGSRVDLGGQWIGHGHDRIAGLVRKAGGTIYQTFSRGLPVIVRDGRTVSLFSPSVLLAMIYMALFEIVTWVSVPQGWFAISVDRAIASWVPLEITRQLLGLIVSILSTAESDTFSIYSFAKFTTINGGLLKMTGTHGGAQDSLVAESMHLVTSMLAQELSPNVMTDMVVTGLSEESTAAHRVTAVRTANGQEFLAKKVIITVPPPMLKSITFEPPLPAYRQALQGNTRMGIVYKAFAVFEKPFWRQGMGGEFLMLDDPACGVFDSTSPGGPGHLCFLVTGTPAHQLDSLDANARRDLILSRLVPHLGPRVLQPVDWQDKAWHLDKYCGGGYTAYPMIGTRGSDLPMSHEAIGDLHWAGTETATDYPGYIEGAVQAGERAAEEVAAALRIVNCKDSHSQKR